MWDVGTDSARVGPAPDSCAGAIFATNLTTGFLAADFFAAASFGAGFLAAGFLVAGFFGAAGFAIGIVMPGMCPACWAKAMLELASMAEAKLAFRIDDVTNHAPEYKMVGRGLKVAVQ